MRVLLLLLAVASLAITGCQPSVGATATGIISFNGVPAPAGVLVMFYPLGPQGSSSMAITDTEGRYDLRFNASVRGVMPGDNVVSLSVDNDLNVSRGIVVTDALRALTIPARYRGPKSPLVKNVKPGANGIDIDVDLKTGPQAD